MRAGSAIIKGFTANWAAVAIVEPGGGITLNWDVINAEQITVARLSANGPLFSGANALLNPPALSSFALGAATHTAGGRNLPCRRSARA